MSEQHEPTPDGATVDPSDVDPAAPGGPQAPVHVDRRRFMNRLFLTTGATAFAAMAGGVGAQAASADSSPSPTATPTAMPTPTGPPTGGGPGGMASAVTESFWGLTTDGRRIDDLYAIHSTGVSTTAVRQATAAFIASLTTAQKSAVLYDIHSLEWQQWSNVDNYTRNGIDIASMTTAQQRLGLAVLTAALSARGLKLTNDIRHLNAVAGKLINATDRFNENLYYVTIMGTPSATEPWGFQFEGHHLVVNYFVLGDQVVMTPSFFGSEPTSGTYNGQTVRVFDTELALGLAMVNSLTPAQQKVAVLSTVKTGSNAVAEAFADNQVQAYTGLQANAMTAAQQTRLLAIIEQFVGNTDTGHAQVKMAEVRAWLSDTHFAWIGATTADAVLYYRIQSPVIWIEFDCETPGPIGISLHEPQSPSRNHIHAVVRTPNGNDYGKELLRQHLLTSPHHTR